MIRYVTLVLTLVCFAERCNGFSTGPPETVCETMTPKHEADRQVAKDQYSLKATRSMTEPNLIKVTIEKGTNEMFKGFMIKAIAVAKEPAGKFIDGRTIKCNFPNDTTTHSEASAKTSYTATFQLQPGYTGPIKFNVTIVKDFKNFYGEFSAKIAII